MERLGDQAEVEHRQVAQATVEHLGGAGRGTCREVAGLDNCGLQATGSGVDCCACANGATADDDDIIFLIGVVLPCLFKVFRVETLIA